MLQPRPGLGPKLLLLGFKQVVNLLHRQRQFVRETFKIDKGRAHIVRGNVGEGFHVGVELAQFFLAALLLGNIGMGADHGADLAEFIPGADAARHHPAPGAVLVLEAENVVVNRSLLDDVIVAHLHIGVEILRMNKRAEPVHVAVEIFFSEAKHRFEFFRHVDRFVDEIKLEDAIIDTVHHGAETAVGVLVLGGDILVFAFQPDDKNGAGEKDADAQNRADEEDVEEIGLARFDQITACFYTGQAMSDAGLDNGLDLVYLGALDIQRILADLPAAVRVHVVHLRFQQLLQAVDAIKQAVGFGESIGFVIGRLTQGHNLAWQAVGGDVVRPQVALVARQNVSAYTGFHIDDVHQYVLCTPDVFVFVAHVIVQVLRLLVLVIYDEAEGAQRYRNNTEKGQVQMLDIESPRHSHCNWPNPCGAVKYKHVPIL